ncbi:MAG: hypothetical protein WCF79_21360, partial [Rhodomicrobium sp.]
MTSGRTLQLPLLAASRQPGGMKLSGAITAATRSEPGLGCAVAMLLTARVSNTTKKTHIDEPALRIPILVSLAAAFGG